MTAWELFKPCFPMFFYWRLYCGGFLAKIEFYDSENLLHNELFWLNPSVANFRGTLISWNQNTCNSFMNLYHGLWTLRVTISEVHFQKCLATVNVLWPTFFKTLNGMQELLTIWPSVLPWLYWWSKNRLAAFPFTSVIFGSRTVGLKVIQRNKTWTITVFCNLSILKPWQKRGMCNMTAAGDEQNFKKKQQVFLNDFETFLKEERD